MRKFKILGFSATVMGVTLLLIALYSYLYSDIVGGSVPLDVLLSVVVLGIGALVIAAIVLMSSSERALEEQKYRKSSYDNTIARISEVPSAGTEERVKIITETSQTTEPKFWNSPQGRIIRAIVLDHVYKKNEILEKTQLSEKEFEHVLSQMLQDGLLEKPDTDRFLVRSRELVKEYRSYFNQLQIDKLLEWVNQWRQKENVGPVLSHFFLEDKQLSDFSEELIEHANTEILVMNPYVDRCHISARLIDMSEKGTKVKVVTRQPDERLEKHYQQKKKNFHSELKEKGVSIKYDDSVHAKLIVVDGCVGIVSSMNFYAGSSGGASWEAGVVTIEKQVVESIAHSILGKT
jgi:hypothetical protein